MPILVFLLACLLTLTRLLLTPLTHTDRAKAVTDTFEELLKAQLILIQQIVIEHLQWARSVRNQKVNDAYLP